MSDILYLEIDFFPIVVLAILYLNSRADSTDNFDNRVLRAVMLLTIATLVFDVMCWHCDGRQYEIARVILTVSTVIYYLLSGVTAFMWFIYTWLKIYGKKHGSKLLWAAFSVPFIVYAFFCVLSPYTGWIFFINGENFYVRGNLFLLQAIVAFGYMLIAAIIALVKRKSSSSGEERREKAYLAAFVVFPLLGGVLQIFCYGISFVWPCTALSLLIVYINTRKRESSLDSLTKLNNRGSFDKYLHAQCVASTQRFFLLLFDIDSFKHINDSFGHLSGDAALLRIAELLVRTFQDSDAFLARYGGDEFAVVFFGDEKQLAAHITEVNDSLSLANKVGSAPYALSVSTGFAEFGVGGVENAERLIEEADRKMYGAKNLKKENAVGDRR